MQFNRLKRLMLLIVLTIIKKPKKYEINIKGYDQRSENQGRKSQISSQRSKLGIENWSKKINRRIRYKVLGYRQDFKLENK